MALQWRESQNTLKPAKTLGKILTTLTLNYASPFAKPTPTSVHVEMIELLIANRANVNAISGYGTGQTPLGLLNKFKINGEFPEGTDSNVFKIERWNS